MTSYKLVVFVGAGGIVRDAHLPAYRKAGIPILGVTDVDGARSASLAEEYGLEQVYEDLSKAVDVNGKDVVYDVATPSGVIVDILPHLPERSAVLV